MQKPHEIHVEVTYIKHMTADFNLLELIEKDNKKFEDFSKFCVRNLIVHISYLDGSVSEHPLNIYIDDDWDFNRANNVDIEVVSDNQNAKIVRLSGAEDVVQSMLTDSEE